jgi:hypothetical protein
MIAEKEQQKKVTLVGSTLTHGKKVEDFALALKLRQQKIKLNHIQT